MTKYFGITLLLAHFTLSSHDMPDRFLGQSVQAVWGSIHSSINSFFIKDEPVAPSMVPAPEEEKDLSMFQKLFRQTITFTNNTANSLSQFAQNVINEAKEKVLTLEQAVDKFIDQVEEAGTDIMKTILNQTLDVDIDLLMPSLENIQSYIAKLQTTVPNFKEATIKPQIEALLNYLQTVQQNAIAIQKAGIPKLTAKLASTALLNKDHKIVRQFKSLYSVYPTVIDKINDLHINDAGKIAHQAFNNSSELIEQIVFLHDSTGKIGRILIDDPLVYPLDSLKNQVRKLGNAVEFVTSTEPVIVLAPPTTMDALLEVLKTFIWRGGFSLKDIAIEKVEKIIALTKPLEKQIQSLIKNGKSFQHTIKQFQPRLHLQFVSKLKENPFTNIPLAPKVLLDLLEQEIEIVKSKLVTMLYQSMVLIHQVSDGISLSAQLLDCINKFMGATKEQPFIHKDIVRGIGFVAEDTVGFFNIIINVTEALKEYNPIPFREEEIV